MENFKKIKKHTCYICGKELDDNLFESRPLINDYHYDYLCCEECNLMFLYARYYKSFENVKVEYEKEICKSRELLKKEPDYFSSKKFKFASSEIIGPMVYGLGILQNAMMLDNKKFFDEMKTRLHHDFEIYPTEMVHEIFAQSQFIDMFNFSEDLDDLNNLYHAEKYGYILTRLMLFYAKDFYLACGINDVYQPQGQEMLDEFVARRNELTSNFLSNENIPIKYKNIFKLTLQTYESVSGVKPILDI